MHVCGVEVGVGVEGVCCGEMGVLLGKLVLSFVFMKKDYFDKSVRRINYQLWKVI